MALPAELDFAKNPSASPDRMNQAMASLDQRLRALELPARTFDQVLSQLQQIGLQRINDALQPYYQALTAIISVGLLFTASSSTQMSPATGPRTFVIDDAQRTRLVTLPFMAAIGTNDPTQVMTGRLSSYDRDTGVLVLVVQAAFGDGIVSDWTLMPAVPLAVPAAIDPGHYDGTSDPDPLIAFAPGILADPGTF